MSKWLAVSLLSMKFLWAFSSCAPQVRPHSETCNFKISSQGQRLTWGNYLPIVFQVHHTTTLEQKQAVQRAMAFWNAEAGRTLFRLSATPFYGVEGLRYDGRNVISFLNSWPQERSAEEQGYIRLHNVGGQIIEADIIINKEHFEYFTLELHPTRFHLDTPLAHELGHALGYAHFEDNDFLMGEFLAFGQTKLELSAYEREAFGCAYGQ